MPVIKMSDLELAGKRVLIREDLNVPIKDGKVSSDVRIRAALPTIEQALSAGAKVILMSHLGRPTEGEFAEEFSLAPVARHLGELLGRYQRVLVPELNSGQLRLVLRARYLLLDRLEGQILSEIEDEIGRDERGNRCDDDKLLHDAPLR